MQDARPMLSIVVPSYNVEAYLGHSLSFYDDDRLDGLVQVIVVDDGSTDSTPVIAQRFASARPDVFTVVSKPNGGHGSAVNAGIAVAAGKYVRVIDGDDWADTANLADFAQRLRDIDSDLVCDVKREVHMVTGESELFPLPSYVPLGREMPFEEICLGDDISSYLMIHTLSLRTDFARAIDLHLLEKTFYVDYEYVVKATLDAETICFVDVNVCQYQVGNSAQSVADDSYVRRWDDHTRVTCKILDIYEQRKGTLSPAIEEYLRQRAVLICNTHYNIAFIFDKDRKRGVKRADGFRSLLKRTHPDIAKLTDRRYRLAKALHYLGVDSQAKLDRLK